jgi:arginine decarboxylase
MTKRITMAAATAGHAEGGSCLNAFDNALLAAGIGNINLMKVSSIVPPAAAIVELPKIRPGALIPTAYAAITSETPGETVAAAVGYALPDDPAKNGVIMEFHGVATQAEAESAIGAMLAEAFRMRGETIPDQLKQRLRAK